MAGCNKGHARGGCAGRMNMSKDHARLTVLIDANKKAEFEQLCAALGTNPSEVVRQLIRDYLRGGSTPPSLLDHEPRAADNPRKGRTD